MVDYSDSHDAVVINLDESGHATGAPSDMLLPENGRIAGGDAIGDTLNSVDGIVGGHGDDILIGNSLANYFDGSAGEDHINAGAGDDIVVYDPTDASIDGKSTVNPGVLTLFLFLILPLFSIRQST